MRTQIIILIGLLITTFACDYDDYKEPNIDGKYIGTFERNEMISNVELNFDNGDFSGESDRTNFPAIYFGGFSVQKHSLDFDNKQTIITTEFDPDLVLNGKWNYVFDMNKLTMINSIGDIYILTKK
jgi:hypothetical protein